MERFRPQRGRRKHLYCNYASLVLSLFQEENLTERNTMKALKKFAAVVAAAGVVVTMSACGAQLESDGTNNSIKTFAVTFPDNTKADCLLFDATASAGVECAFDKTSTSTEKNDSLIGSIETIAGEKVRCVTYDWSKEGAMDCEM